MGEARILQHHHNYRNHRKSVLNDTHHKRRRVCESSKLPNPCFWFTVFRAEAIADKNWSIGRSQSRKMINGGQRKTFAQRKERAKWERRPLWGWACAYSHLQAFDVSPHYIAAFIGKKMSTERKVALFSFSQGLSDPSSFKKACTFSPFKMVNEYTPSFGEYIKLAIVSSTADEAIILILDGSIAMLWKVQGLNDPSKKRTSIH